MKKSILLLLLLAISQYLLAQHDIKALFYNPANLSVNEVSFMYEGEIENNLMRFRSIASAADGELVWDIANFKLTDSVTYSLKNVSTNALYSIVLANGKIQIVAATTFYKGTFVTGDKFKIVRCKNAILYFHNGVLIHQYVLPNNTFQMIGEIKVHKALNTGSNLAFRTL